VSESTLKTDNRVILWFERRLPILSLMNEALVVYPTPKNLSWWWTFGSLAGIALVIMIMTGIVLAMHYVPHVDYAFLSVEHIMRDVNYGWLIRYVHANCGSMFFLVVYIHIFRGLYYGSYKEPRELLWIIGLLIYVLMMASGFLGYVLPWGQMSFWAVTVITSLFSAIPFVGDAIVTWLWGGYGVGNPTLTRFYSLHYLMPFLIFAVVFLHLWALHTTKSSNPLGVEVKTPKDTIPFHPYFTAKDLVGLAVFMIVLFALVFFAPNYLSHPDNYIPANPLVTPAHIVPEWYYLPFYAVLRAIPDKLGGVIAMFASLGILFLVPWLDTSKVRSSRFRPIYKQFFWILVADCIVLGWVGANPPEGYFVLLGRVATAYYFLHFLVILPVVGMIEKPLPLPESISEPALKGGAD
jgi:quinol-cytochrome oxidoreductase complex cytochrome b subunit